ncbi:MAG TPA: phage tail sheath subtilisin-like domain-containing protein [Longimicrobium sp.]|nr:phage tail sheath subtilisin-like domain-containing protein [Longimicrobium sp.]
MPSQLSYPGVYIEELPSGVRTVTGVATSITAFVGYTAQGPVDRAVQVFNFGDYQREFGGLHRDSEVSYAVQQFFINGGSNALVVRVARGAAAASVGLENADGAVVLTAAALSPGEWGNFLRIDVDHATTAPDSLFNLTVTRVDAAQAVLEREEFRNLSMSARSAAYAVATVNAGSRLLRLTRPGGLAFGRGWALSGDVSAPGLGAAQSQVVGILNGVTPFTLTLQSPDTQTTPALLETALNDAIVNAGLSGRVIAERALGTGAANAAGNFVRLVSQAVVGEEATEDEHSSVTILPAPVPANDAAAALGLGAVNGGRERTGAARARPVPTGTTSGDLGAFAGVAAGQNLDITLFQHAEDGTTQQSVHGILFEPASTELDEALRADLEAAIHTAPSPLLQAAVVERTGARLRVRLPEGAPRARAVLSGIPELAFPAAGDAGSNLQRYLLGSALSQGGQTAGDRGSDGTPPDGAAYLGSQSLKTGIYALRDADLFNLLCIPGTPRLPGAEQAPVIQAAIGLCEEERAFFIVDPPRDATRDTVVAWAAGVTSSRNAAVYFPRVLAADPLDAFRVRDMAASGAVAGVMARTDAERGVWKAPAGTDAVLRGTQGLAVVLTDMENGVLNQQGVNVLRSFPVYGRVVWGARTRKGADQQADEYKYIPVRRLALYIEETLFRNTQWVVFEPNDEPLWSQIRLNVGAFMQDLFRRGAFQGSSPDKAYLVKCDAETTTQYDIDRGIVNILVAFAPLKPAEFVVIQIQQKAQLPA